MQIVLLTLLVSFVTSIATGIVTVTLMDQAPPAITQTLNRVVERTVERVVPDKSQGASVITKEVTVIVKEDDLITNSIDKNTKSVVRIREADNDGKAGKLIGLGVIVSNDGIIVTDDSVAKSGSVYKIETANGDIFDASVIDAIDSKSFSFILIKKPEAGGKDIVFFPVALSNASAFKLGQTVISLTGEGRTDVEAGIISGFIENDAVVEDAKKDGKEDKKEEPKTKTVKILSFIKTNIVEKNVVVGSPLIDMFGEVIGISTTGLFISNTALFTPVDGIETILSNLQLAGSGAKTTGTVGD